MKNNKKGFTLLEIIIVIIIVGVLASVALPKLTSNIEFAKSAEALNAIGVLKRGLESCSVMGGTVDWTKCTALSDIGITYNPYVVGNFALCLVTDTAIAATGGRYIVEAYKSGTCAGADAIFMTVTAAADGSTIVTKSGIGNFTRIK
ncbi:MAG: prepilin-type N-terminal cleavage/methylation domain-containing protein [Candidatus Omnitrophica bacterium]|nr:prepilin-type N-terminal cleavage/methylation domain-containing protein [Candidatus Omnitrophota bacterium]